MVESNDENMVNTAITTTTTAEDADEQRLNDFRATVARKCQTYRNAKSNEITKLSNVRQMLESDLGAHVDVKKELKEYKEELGYGDNVSERPTTTTDTRASTTDTVDELS